MADIHHGSSTSTGIDADVEKVTSRKSAKDEAVADVALGGDADIELLGESPFPRRGVVNPGFCCCSLTSS
jgi:hypothetical protein